MNTSQVRAERIAWLEKQLLRSGKFLGEQSHLTRNSFALAFATEAGRRYSIQASADLMNWQDWTAVAGDGTTLTLSDGSVPDRARRFYRSVVQP